MTRRNRVRIDMTPMVDVAFLLLIFFMSTTQFKPPEQVAVDLPLSSSEIHVPETGTIILTVNRTGQMFISSEIGPRPAGAGAGQRARRHRQLARPQSRRGGGGQGRRDASFGAMADLMDALAESKTLRFNLMTDLKRDPAPAEG